MDKNELLRRVERIEHEWQYQWSLHRDSDVESRAREDILWLCSMLSEILQDDPVIDYIDSEVNPDAYNGHQIITSENRKLYVTPNGDVEKEERRCKHCNKWSQSYILHIDHDARRLNDPVTCDRCYDKIRQNNDAT